MLKALSARLDASAARGGRFIVGDKLTIADLVIGSFIFNSIYNELNPEGTAALKPAFETHEQLIKYTEALRAELGSYLETRPKSVR